MYEPVGCVSCGGTGYLGRIGLYEGARPHGWSALILDKASSKEIEAVAVDAGMHGSVTTASRRSGAASPRCPRWAGCSAPRPGKPSRRLLDQLGCPLSAGTRLEPLRTSARLARAHGLRAADRSPRHLTLPERVGRQSDPESGLVDPLRIVVLVPEDQQRPSACRSGGTPSSCCCRRG